MSTEPRKQCDVSPCSLYHLTLLRLSYLLLEEVYDGVGLGQHVEEVELRDGLAVGHGNALLVNVLLRE